MSEENLFKQSYRSGDTPWDIGKPDFNLIQTVAATPIKPCKALEIGCGTGDNAIWLSQQNFHVVGIDASELAIEKAKSKAGEANVKCNFIMSNKIDPPSPATVTNEPAGSIRESGRLTPQKFANTPITCA